MALSTRQLEVECKHRLQSRQTCSVIREFMVGEGMPDSAAQDMITKTLSSLRKQAFFMFIFGVVIALFAVIISIMSEEATGGMMIFIWWGPVLFGVFMVIVSLVKLISLKKRL